MSDIEKTGSQSNPVEIKEEELSTLIKELSIKSSIWRGPLPPPEILAAYKNIQENLPDRIVKMAEIEQKSKHRHIYIGQFSAIIIGVITIIGGIIVILSGRSTVGLVEVISTLAVLVGVYIGEKAVAKSKKKKNE